MRRECLNVEVHGVDFDYVFCLPEDICVQDLHSAMKSSLDRLAQEVIPWSADELERCFIAWTERINQGWIDEPGKYGGYVVEDVATLDQMIQMFVMAYLLEETELNRRVADQLGQ